MSRNSSNTKVPDGDMDWSLAVPARRANAFHSMVHEAIKLHTMLTSYVALMEEILTAFYSYCDDVDAKLDFWKYYEFPRLINQESLLQLVEDLDQYREVYSKLRFTMDALEDKERDLKDLMLTLLAAFDV